MRIVVQRSREAWVDVNKNTVGRIPFGLVLLVGIKSGDSAKDADYLAEKIVHLRIFEDDEGKMNRSVLDVGGAILSVSQFTLFGDVRKGRRPNFMAAAQPDEAQSLWFYFNELLKEYGLLVETGQFGAMMDVHLCNDGPVTLLLDSEKLF
ncbi:D-aminoacyl-tRNA deacylase [Alicyclobacillus tolerans]|uniref:D-aminoacyl-tRNA deacylase n=2 Tax=Alicyclobacillus tolerans TaxID=90970 RepID=A0A1M6K936_9BACL|nr:MULTISPECIES: D-aminoacyl-tRNA deacylase [Alicyclobacillus]MDP9727278.1 D-tyrosyl-tRNA(Tyr) deacylase [Alicyclobacillus tengchongensis]SHJ55423.1 D-tyrosyl-tRNA(Tyr) deacylase [Alicyclobacillus montanus]